VIAPYWSDFDIRGTDGVVYLGQYTRLSPFQRLTTQADAVFTAVTNLVMIGAGDSGFLPTEVAVVTWQDVRPWPAFFFQSQVKSIRDTDAPGHYVHWFYSGSAMNDKSISNDLIICIR